MINDYYKIQGIRHTKGEYEGRPYDNYKLTLSMPLILSQGETGAGLEAFEKNIKAADFRKVTGVPISHIPYLVDCYAKINFDRYGGLGKNATLLIVSEKDVPWLGYEKYLQERKTTSCMSYEEWEKQND